MVRKYKSKYAANKSLGFQSLGSPVRSPFPPTLWTTLTYTDTFTFASAVAGLPTIRSYRANGMYDPLVLAGGIQPRYYDTLLGGDGGVAPYRTYRVHACKASVMLWPTSSAANAGNSLISLIPRRATITGPSTVDETRERPYGKHCAMTTVGSYKPRKLSNFVKIKTILSRKDLADDSDTGSRYDTTPAAEVYWDLVINDIRGTATAEVECQLTLTYFVQLYGLTDVGDS